MRPARGLALALVHRAGCHRPVKPQPQPDGRLRPHARLSRSTDQTGATFSSQSLAGQVTLLDFVYTHCTDACPLLSATFQQTQRKLADDKLLGSRVMLVSLSVDPQHDTPAVLADYGQQFKADPAAGSC